jgi:hypothetical protein
MAHATSLPRLRGGEAARMARPHPAGRILLLYAACLAAMLVAALAIAVVRNAPAPAVAGEARVVEAQLR